jgi:hypothetical protein
MQGNRPLDAKKVAEIIAAANRAAGLGDGFIRVCFDLVDRETEELLRPSVICGAADAPALMDAISSATTRDDRTICDLSAVYLGKGTAGEARRCIVPISFLVGYVVVPDKEHDVYDPDDYNEGGEQTEPASLDEKIASATAEIGSMVDRMELAADHLRSLGFFAVTREKETSAATAGSTVSTSTGR